MNKLPTLMQALKAQNLIEENVVTFRLSHTAAESDMIVGGEDASYRKGDFVWHPVTSQSYWLINIDSIKLNGTVVASNLKGIVDTGTSLIVGGTNTIGSIASVSVSQDCSTDAATLPPVTFTIGGVEYTLSGPD